MSGEWNVMKLRNDVFSSYPVIQEDNIDFRTKIFTANITMVESRTNARMAVFHVDCSLTNQYIKDLISNGKAKIYVHCECPVTSFRINYPIAKLSDDIIVPSAFIMKTLELNVFICLEDDIDNYNSPDFSDEFKGIVFNLKKGQIIGKSHTFIADIIKSGSDFQNWPSVITIVRDTDNPDTKLNVHYNDDKITIYLNAENYDIYSNFNSKEIKNILIRLVVFPAIIEVLCGIRLAEDSELYVEKNWYKVVEAQLKALDPNFDNLQSYLLNRTPLEIANMLFKDSLSQSFQEINEMMNS